MGIDPLTHEPLHKAATPQQTFCQTNDMEVNQEEPPKACSHVSSNDNSNTHTENSSTDESRSSDPGDDDLLMSHIWFETFLDDSFWNSPVASGNFGLPSSEGNSEWFLDYKDFGDEDFGLGCLSDGDIDSTTWLASTNKYKKQ